MTDLNMTMPKSLWAATAVEGPDCPPLKGNLNTEVAIIGAGFTGLCAALHLAESNIEAIVVDAGEPGIGASGRNGGQANPGIKRTIDQVAPIWGWDASEQLYKVIGTAPDYLFDLISRYNINCQPIQNGLIQPAFSKKSLDYLTQYGEYQASMGAPIEFLDQQQTQNLIGSDFYLGGFLDKRGGSVQPLSYCRGLANTVIQQGQRIFGKSPIVGIDALGNKKLLATAQGKITANSILICTNGYTDLVGVDGLLKKLSRTVIPIYSYQVATESLSDTLTDSILSGGHTVADTRRLLTYFRRDHTGRLIMGGAGGPYDAKSHNDFSHIEARITQIYPQLKETKIAFRWSGKVCLTMDHVPHVHELCPNVFTGLGYNGRGVAMSSLMGKWLASKISKKQIKTVQIPVTHPKSIVFHGLRKPIMKVIQLCKDSLDRLER